MFTETTKNLMILPGRFQSNIDIGTFVVNRHGNEHNIFLYEGIYEHIIILFLFTFICSPMMLR